MIKRKKRKCKGCGRDHYLFGKGLCEFCYKKQPYKAKPKNKPIKKISERQKSILNEYGKVRANYLKEHPCCEVGLPGCSGCEPQLMQIHHKKGKASKDLWLDTTFYLAVCYSCHIFIEQNPEIAYENGWSISRHEK